MSKFSPFYEENYQAIFQAPDIKTGGAHLIELLKQVKKGDIWGKKQDDVSMLYENFTTFVGKHYADAEPKWLPLGNEMDGEDPDMANQRAINIIRFVSEVYPNSQEALIAVCSSASEKGSEQGRQDGYKSGFSKGKENGYKSGYDTARPKFLTRGALLGGFAGIALGVAATLFFTNKKEVAPSSADNKAKTAVYQKSAAHALTRN